MLPSQSQLLSTYSFWVIHCAAYRKSTASAPFALVAKTSTLHALSVWSLAAILKRHAMNLLLCGIQTPQECQLHLQTSLSALAFFLLLWLSQGLALPFSQYNPQVLPIFRRKHFTAGDFNSMFCLVCDIALWNTNLVLIPMCYVSNTALSRIKQTFVPSLPSDFWSLHHFVLAINKSPSSAVASVITGLKALK